jgi:hypothetical protein
MPGRPHGRRNFGHNADVSESSEQDMRFFMRFLLVTSLCAILLTGTFGLARPVWAQAPKPTPPAAAQPQAAPAPAPVRPYKPVAVRLPEPMKDAGFEAFRKQLAEAAQKKDRTALSRLVVAQGFFWEAEDGDKADKKKSGIDNLAIALGLSGKDAAGWDLLASYAADPTAAPLPDRANVVCAPADPGFDDKALEDLARNTQTDPSEWGYPVADGVEVHSAAQANAPVLEKLGLAFVRVLPDETTAGGNAQAPSMIRVATPSGKTGFVAADAIAPLGNDQLCYVKDTNSWKITGYIGGGSEQ